MAAPLRTHHPDDIAVRATVAAELIRLRTRCGTQAAHARRIHSTGEAVSSWERKAGQPHRFNPQIRTAQAYALGVDRHLALTIAGITVADSADAATYTALAEAADPWTALAWWRAAWRAQLVDTRHHHGVTQVELADRLGVDPAAVWQVEQGDAEPMLATWQRYVRALGGVLHLDLQPLTTTEGKAA